MKLNFLKLATAAKYLLFLVLIGLFLFLVVGPLLNPDKANNGEQVSPKLKTVSAKKELDKKMTLREIGSEDADSYRPVENVFLSEELIISLSPTFTKLSTAAKNMMLLNETTEAIFTDQSQFHGRLKFPEKTKPDSTSTDEEVASSIFALHWHIEDGMVSQNEEMWRDYFQQINYFDHAKFYVIEAHYDLEREHWYANMGFKALAKTGAGNWQAAKAKIKTTWLQEIEADNPLEGWRIDQWKLIDFKTEETENLMFQNVVNSAIPNAQVRNEVVRSIHEEQVIQQILKGDKFEKPYPSYKYMAFESHPGIAVADVNQDGFDDIYLMERNTKNQLLLSQGDGTFREAAAELGLDIEGQCSSAVFFDADNDGDADVFIGRSYEPSVYLINENGVFERADKSSFPIVMPRNVSSVAAADYDNDGLLDLYVSTYDPAYRKKNVVKSNNSDSIQTQYTAVNQKYSHPSQRLIDQVGPRNQLFHNIGEGKFEKVKTNLSINRLTYQSTWSDYDDDGDQDLYCANDFGPDYLFRNDGGGSFTDVTLETGLKAITSLSMGAVWGDYNNNGRLDLYVSGMYSKAGKRVLGGIEGEDPRLMQTAYGNTLFEQNVSSGEYETDFSALLDGVERMAGWAYGSQFADIDNDGDQDLYVVSGFYTAPPALARPGDQ